MFEVVQCVRECRPGGGVSGVAHALDTAFRNKRLRVGSFTIRDLGVAADSRVERHRYLAKFGLLLDVLYFSLVGTLVARRRFDRSVTICHNDMLFGDVYVNHGLHRAMLDASGHKWRMLLRNPIHAFLVLREWCRLNLGVHRCHVCFSQADADQMKRYYPRTAGRIRIIPNGVDIHRFRPDPGARVETRQQYGLAEDAFVLAFVGHEFERKGLYPLVEALTHLPETVRLLVVGGSRQEISRASSLADCVGVTARVHFLGVIGTVERVMNAADALVLPSRFEAWPLVGLEAMACATPVLMTATGGVLRFLEDGVNGHVIECSPEDIARKVERLRGDGVALSAMRQAAHRTALRFSWESIADQYLELLGAGAVAPGAKLAAR